MDYSLLLPLVILCVLGVIMVYSSSSIVAISRHNWPANYFLKQLITLAIGTVLLVIVASLPYKFWRKRIILSAMGLGSIALLATLIFGKEINGAKVGY